MNREAFNQIVNEALNDMYTYEACVKLAKVDKNFRVTREKPEPAKKSIFSRIMDKLKRRTPAERELYYLKLESKLKTIKNIIQYDPVEGTAYKIEKIEKILKE